MRRPVIIWVRPKPVGSNGFNRFQRLKSLLRPTIFGRTRIIFASFVCTLALLGFSTVALQTAAVQTAASWPRGKSTHAPDQTAPYTASADYTLAVPAIDAGAGWQTALHVQNTGAAPTSARIEFFATTDVECPTSREPVATRCIGPIPAGAAHTFDVGSDPLLADAQSALVHSAQPEGAGCGLRPGEPLAVVVQRRHVEGEQEDQIVSSNYVGVAPAVAGFWDAERAAHVSVIPWVEITGTKRTILHLQNVGLACTGEIELGFIPEAGCVPTLKTLPNIAPGHSLKIELADMLETELDGSAWIWSPQPVAVVVDRWPDDATMLSTHATGRAAGHQNVDAPLILQRDDGWSTSLQSQNASTQITALTEMIYRTSEVTPTLESEIPICVGGSTSIDVAAVEGLTSPFTGTVALQSLSRSADQPEIPPLAADVDLLVAGGGAAYHAPNRITDTLAAPDVALPWLTRAYRPPTASSNLTYTSQIAVFNQSDAGDGFVSLTFYEMDGSMITSQTEPMLRPRTMRLVDLAEIPELPAGWHGSAVLEFLSTEPGASIGVVVLETASGGAGDTTTAYAGIAAQVQAQPTPTPSPTETAMPTATATPQTTATPTATPPAPKTYLPLLYRSAP